MTRVERRLEIMAEIEKLKTDPPGEVRDLKIRLLAMERDRIDDWQIVDHYQLRHAKVRESLLEFLEIEHGKKNAPGELDLIDADWRAEAESPMPACRHCGKSPLEARREPTAEERAALGRYVRSRMSSCLNTIPHDKHGDCPGLGSLRWP